MSVAENLSVPEPGDDLVDAIIEIWRQREDFHTAEKSLTLRIKALCRRACGGERGEADKLYKAIMNDGEHPAALNVSAAALRFLTVRADIEKDRKQLEKRLRKMAEALPVASYVKSEPGLDFLGLAGLVGECCGVCGTWPDGSPKTVSTLWKRMGVAVMPDGTRQRRVSGQQAIEHGYSPRRRAVLYRIGSAVVKSGGDGKYRKIYLDRKEYERRRAQERGLTIVPAEKMKKMSDTERERHISVGHIDNRARRFMEKRIVRDFFNEWRRSVEGI